MIEINKVYNENCLDTMAKMPDNFINLTVTSPPYDNLRTYKNNIGLEWNFTTFKLIAKELYRITKKGGVVVWIVGDATIDGSETGTSFKQALYFKKIGFNLHDTMIYQKYASTWNETSKRYKQNFEYMFIFSKGKPSTFNPIRDIKIKNMQQRKVKGNRNTDNPTYSIYTPKNEYTVRNNIINYATGVNHTDHPAIFPEQLAKDHIISWSNENDLVYDPFMGSGTTAKMAFINHRNYIGSEISEEYCEISKERLKGVRKYHSLTGRG